MILPTPTTYALLGLLGIQSWSAYDLVAQSRRGLHFWPRSEAHLYAELKRLVKLGYADAERITVGRRISTHYTITTAGRDALAAWLRTPPSPPVLECEALLRVLFADQGSVEDLLATLRATHEQATAMLGNSLEMLREVLTTGGLFPERRHLGVPLADFGCSLSGVNVLPRRWPPGAPPATTASHRRAEPRSSRCSRASRTFGVPDGLTRLPARHRYNGVDLRPHDEKRSRPRKPSQSSVRL